MNSAACSFFSPYLKRTAPVSQKTVPPAPSSVFGSAPKRSLARVFPRAGEPEVSILVLDVVGGCCAANACSSGV